MQRVAYICLLSLACASVCVGQSREAIERTELGVLQNYYATQDPAYANVVARLPDIETTLNQLKDRLTAAQATRPGQAEISSCLQIVNTALRRTTSALKEIDVSQYGNIRTLVTIPDEDVDNLLAKVNQCTGS